MRDEYDFSQSVPNPYLKKLKKQVSINLEDNVVDYFQKLSKQTGIPYQNLINLYISISNIVYGLSESHRWNGSKRSDESPS
jgi:predicted DNA binding CopG/RHH family protein